LEDHRKTIGNELENYSKSKKTTGIRWKTIVIRWKRIGKTLGTNNQIKIVIPKNPRNVSIIL